MNGVMGERASYDVVTRSISTKDMHLEKSALGREFEICR